MPGIVSPDTKVTFPPSRADIVLSKAQVAALGYVTLSACRHFRDRQRFFSFADEIKVPAADSLGQNQAVKNQFPLSSLYRPKRKYDTSPPQ